MSDDGAPRVFVTQWSGFRDRSTGKFVQHDLRPAQKFGEVITLMPSHPGDPALAPAPMTTYLRHALRHFNSDDFILPMGSPAVICTAAALASRYNMGKIKVLIWDRRLKDYYVTNLEI